MGNLGVEPKKLSFRISTINPWSILPIASKCYVLTNVSGTTILNTLKYKRIYFKIICHFHKVGLRKASLEIK